LSSKPIYFQWQNEFLLKTIYPLREMKLRDFLIFYQEIDLWAEYKGKSLSNMQNEVEAFRETQTRLWSEAYDLTQKFKEEFIAPTVAEDYRKKYPNLDPELHRRSTLLFSTFKTYFPRIKSVENERYFLTQRISEWEITRKWVAKQVERLQRDLRNMPATWVHRPQREQTLAALEKHSLPMADEVLDKMYAFLSATAKVEKRRVELKKWKDQKTRDKAMIVRQREQLVRDAQALEKKHLEAAEVLRRLKNPPSLASLEAYFNEIDITSKVQAEFGAVDSTFIDKANQAHKNIASFFKTVTNEASRANFVKGQLNQIDLLRRQTETRIEQLKRDLRNMPASWNKRQEREQELQKLSEVTLGMVRAELGRLEDFVTGLSNRGKNQAELTQLTAQKEKEFEGLDARLRALRSEAAKLENEMALLDQKIGQSEKEQLLTFLKAQEVTLKDIVNSKIEEYRKTLESKDQYELLELIIQRFHKDPTRYPLWLQYMVIHFSGMRYQSAHGSWADPKDLLLALRMKDIEGELKRADDIAIEALCTEKLAVYQPGAGPAGSNLGTGPTTVKPKLAQALEARWKSKLEYHLRRLDSASPYTRRKALLDLRIDEENYEIDKMTDQQALDSLDEIKDELPEWMWKEIVKLTQLRLTEVKDKNWESLTPEEQEEQYASQWREYRKILDDWKRQNLTGWREEHDRANKLIVTRAVCNEVAEHIQHLRGHTPPGGLTAKPEWYLRKEKDPKLVSGSVKPFLIKPKQASDFKEGASILWLSFVHGEPNPWRIAHPVLVRGEGLLSPGLIGGGSRPKPSNPNAPGSWGYTQDSRSFRRSRNTKDARGQSIHEEQWLRWIHEATVAAAAETAEGTVVLTFETALPHEDKRQSTIGVFKHYLDYVRHAVNVNQFTPSFVGYVPPGELPMSDLREMLDWNKILLKDYVSSAEMQAYRDTAGILSVRSLGPRQPTVVSTWLEAAPPLRCENHSEYIACYLVDPKTKTASAYQPEVPLRRGTVMKVSISELVKIGEETYYPVSECQAEPRAVELHVRASEAFDLRQEKEPRFVKAGGRQQLYELTGADASGRPQLKPVDIHLLEGTRLRISTIHRLSDADPGDGMLTDGQNTYALILECPSRSSVNGLFVQADEVMPEKS
jgi:hypothetical protein